MFEDLVELAFNLVELRFWTQKSVLICMSLPRPQRKGRHLDTHPSSPSASHIMLCIPALGLRGTWSREPVEVGGAHSCPPAALSPLPLAACLSPWPGICPLPLAIGGAGQCPLFIFGLGHT